MTYLTSTTQAAIIAAQAQISANCSLPNSYGTSQWDIVTKAINSNLWFISKPSSAGWGNSTMFTQAQMMAGVDITNIIEQEYNASWFPSFPGI